ncbi:winged helix-turn-helix domain-containing protein [Streptomyces sp. NPDC004393]
MLRSARVPWPDASRVPATRLAVADLEMNEAAREVNRGGESLHLTPNGFGPLRFLMPNPGRVHTAAEILEHVWSYESVIKPASSSCTFTTCGRKSTPPASHSSCQVPATCCGRNGHERGRNLPEVHQHPRHTVGCAPWQQAQEPRIPRRLSFASRATMLLCPSIRTMDSSRRRMPWTLEQSETRLNAVAAAAERQVSAPGELEVAVMAALWAAISLWRVRPG